MRCFLSCALALAMLFTGTAAYGDAPAISPTTGLPTDKEYRPLLVQISNTREARPIIGLADADIVYEAVYWGPRHTRYLALFNDNHPAQVGSVRSTRAYFFELREMWDCPYAFWGRQSSTIDRIDANTFLREYRVSKEMLFDGSQSGLAMSRIRDRFSPHNAVTDASLIADQYWPVDEQGNPYAPKLPNLVFSDDASRSDSLVSAIDVIYEAKDYAARYVYDADAETFVRWYDGKPQVDASGKAICAANVIVLYMDLLFYGNILALPVIKTTGSGPMDIFLEGTHTRGVWHRENMDDFVRYIGDNGEDIVLSRGKTFVQIVPMDMEIHITHPDGSTSALDASR